MAIPALLANFDGDLSAETRNGPTTLTSSGPVRFVEGAAVGSSAYVAEEGTTNYIRNPRGQMTGDSIPGWYLPDSWDSVQDTDVTIDGVPTVRLTYTGTGSLSHAVEGNTGIVGGEIMSGSIKVRADGPVDGLYVRLWASGGTSYIDGGETYPDFVNDADEDGWVTITWENITVPMTVTSIDRISIFVYSSAGLPVGTSIWMGQPQTEKKPYCTTYTDGSLGPGYTWAGTANNSPSTRAASKFSISQAASGIRADAGALAVRIGTEGIKRYAVVGTFANYVMYVGDDLVGGPALLVGFYHHLDGNTVVPRVTLVGGNNQYTHAPLFADEAAGMLKSDLPPYMDMFVEWEDNERLRVSLSTGETYLGESYSGGVAVPGVYSAGGKVLFQQDTDVEFGHVWGDYHLNGPVDAAAIFSRRPTDAERTKLMNAPTWEWETLIPRFGGIHVLAPIEPIAVAVSVPVDVTGG